MSLPTPSPTSCEGAQPNPAWRRGLRAIASTRVRRVATSALALLLLAMGTSVVRPALAQVADEGPTAARALATPSDVDPNASAATLATPDVPAASPDSELEPPPPPPRTHESSLAEVLEARKRIDADLRALQAELGTDDALGREDELERQIQALAKSRSELERNFSELASGFDPEMIAGGQQTESLSLSDEIRELLSPLVNELKRATSRPREIDRLRTEISQLRDQLSQVKSAIKRVKKLQDEVTDPSVKEALDTEKQAWDDRAAALRTSLTVAQRKLDQRLSESQSIRGTIENVFQIFFKSRGRNLFLALLATFAFLLGLRKLRDLAARRPALNRHSASFRGRIFSLIYSLFMGVGALLVFLMALYLFGDWVLLILVLLLILGAIWTSKRAIPRFWAQTVLLLDMGPVREGERLIHLGLPWRVDSISFYSDLSNPELEGGNLRLPIDDLSALRSRPYSENEPWFPTRTGDVILLPDERPAKVEFQSAEIVRLLTQGNNQIMMPTRDFAAQSIERLSDGYRVSVTFGLDYQDQAEITTSMPAILEHGIASAWRESPWADSLLSTLVEFQSAGASSLDLFVRVDLTGDQAMDIEAQKRFLARVSVDVCNEQGWTIPFTQLTLHVAGDRKDATQLPIDPAGDAS